MKAVADVCEIVPHLLKVGSIYEPVFSDSLLHLDLTMICSAWLLAHESFARILHR
jgi:hypothetical protein